MSTAEKSNQHQPLLPADIAAQTFDLLTVAVFWVNARGCVVHRNRAAEQLLAERDGLTSVHGYLSTADSDSTRRLRQLLKSLSENGGSAGENWPAVLLLKRPSGRGTLAVLASPLETHHEVVGAVFVIEPQKADLPSSALLARLYGLTNAEARLAAELLAGKSLPEVADQSGISRNTLKTHLKALFQKTGAKRQAQLIGLLALSRLMIRPSHSD